MSTRKGRCPNLELCSNATSQRLMELPDDEPFICPRCSTDLQGPPPKIGQSGRRKMLALQIAIMTLGVASIGYQLRSGGTTHTLAQLDAVPEASAGKHLVSAVAPPGAPAKPSMLAASEPAKPAPIAAAAKLPPAPPATVLLRLAGPDDAAHLPARRQPADYLMSVGDADIETGGHETSPTLSASTAGGFGALHSQTAIAPDLPPAAPAEATAPGSIATAPAQPVAVVDSGLQAQPASVADASQRFRAFVGSAERLPTIFRFESASTVLDRRSLREVDRLAATLRARHIAGGQLILAGFADNAGSPAANDVVAQQRVAAVTAALGRSGLAIGRAASFGSEMPLADNATETGRERNRRVEAYLIR